MCICHTFLTTGGAIALEGVTVSTDAAIKSKTSVYGRHAVQADCGTRIERSTIIFASFWFWAVGKSSIIACVAIVAAFLAFRRIDQGAEETEEEKRGEETERRGGHFGMARGGGGGTLTGSRKEAGGVGERR